MTTATTYPSRDTGYTAQDRHPCAWTREHVVTEAQRAFAYPGAAALWALPLLEDLEQRAATNSTRMSWGETVFAGPLSVIHVRSLAPGEDLRPGGALSTSALCGRDLVGGWDLGYATTRRSPTARATPARPAADAQAASQQRKPARPRGSVDGRRAHPAARPSDYRGVTFRIDPDDRVTDPAVFERAAALKREADEFTLDTYLERLSADGVTLSLPHLMTAQLASIVEAMFTGIEPEACAP